MISFEDYCYKYEEKIIQDLVDSIYDLDIPEKVASRLTDEICAKYIDDIMLDRYESSISDFEDMQYEQHKEEQLL